MLYPRIDSIPAGLYVIFFIFYLCTGVHTKDPPINCGRDRIYVNLFKVLVDDNSNIQSVIEELGVLGFEYKQQYPQRIHDVACIHGEVSLHEKGSMNIHRHNKITPSLLSDGCVGYQVVSNFHSFRLKEDFDGSRCPINRNWIKEVHSDKILSIEQDFHRIIDPLDYADRADVHAYISIQNHTTLPFTTSTSGSRRYHHMVQQGRVATGNNVTVTIGVVDIGFDMTHPNLKDKINVPLSYDFFNEDPDPSPPINCPPFNWDNDPLFRSCSHGTMCMGIIGNSHIPDSECNRGICDGIQLAGLKIMDNMRYPTDIQEARALESQPDKIDIISASYGKADNIGYRDVGQVSKEALRHSVKMGRKCKGRIFVFPSGNGGRSDNCNMDGYAKNVHSITVTNVGSDLKVPFLTEICPCTLAAAVLDIKFKTAALDHACLGDFTSSSAAVPTAAGHIANMLKVNPTLTKRDVEHIIVLTALPIGFTGVQWKKNGAGLLYNNQLGFGILNPPLMLEKAKIWHHVPEQLICDCKAVQNTADTTSCCDIRYLEHMEVELRMCCRNCFDNDLATVDIDVTSPSNTLSRVMTYSKIQADRGDAKKDRCRNWTFMTVNFWLEDPVGKWSVNWSARQIDIEVDTLKVVFYGTIADPRTTPGGLPECETAQPDVRKLPTETKKSNIALMVITVVVTVMGLLVLVCLYKCRRYLRRRRMTRVEEIQMRDGREL